MQLSGLLGDFGEAHADESIATRQHFQVHVPALPHTISIALREQSLQANIGLDDQNEMYDIGA